MLPAVGLISVAWVLACFTFSRAAVYDPTQCCTCDLKPSNVPDGTSPQFMPSPFKIVIQENEYRSNTEIHVDLVADVPDGFRSFMLGAYLHPYKEGSKPRGQIKLLPDQDFQVTNDCFENDGIAGTTINSYVVKSQDDKVKRNLKFVWTASRQYGHIEFRATFVRDDDTYWVSEKSRILTDPTAPLTHLPRKSYIPPINVDECGKSKGCFREPAGCVEPSCLYIFTWRPDDTNQYIDMELGGLADNANDRYVAVALSDDTYMGDDTVITCAHNSANDRTQIYLSYNKDDPKRNIPLTKYEDKNSASQYLGNAIVKEAGSYNNGRLRCRFTLHRDLDQYYPDLNAIRGGPSHLLFAHGFANKGSPKRHGLSVEQLPLASANKIDLSTYTNIHGRARYPLAKAHGCLMILAWVFFASVGLLLTKYYKPMWPNKRMFGQRYWFLGHFNFMATMFILSIIGIILIFVEAGGYSEAPDLPQKAHPILGIIILVCIIINPILALIRPSEDSKCRPVFNWFHWAFGTIANVLAIPTIFIGMDFGKVMVPWWATWILVIWVIFHIAVELSLEIHQCCTYKKNKERRKKWEQLKREYPKQHHPEPEPAGRRFKRFMLFLHVGFTLLITLIMIIIIAVV